MNVKQYEKCIYAPPIIHPLYSFINEEEYGDQLAYAPKLLIV